jgi:phosphatidylglycerophosphatase A
VVIDEVAGQLVTLAGLHLSWLGVLAGFLVFRVLDIVKPRPARQFEELPHGLGIMADDLMAGVYGWAIMFAAARFIPGL